MAPLKQPNMNVIQVIVTRFHGLYAVAPLKRTSGSKDDILDAFPRPLRRGPIEATRTSSVLRSMVRSFHGLYAVAPLKHSESAWT